MSLVRICRQVSAVVVVILCTVAAGSATVRAEKAALPPAIQLLLDGKLREGAQSLGLRTLDGAELLQEARRLRTSGVNAFAAPLYEVYFRHFAYYQWHESSHAEWTDAANEYVALLRGAPEIDPQALLRNGTAAELYRQLLEIYGDGKVAEYGKLTEELITKHPQSIFAPAAVLTTIAGRSFYGHGGSVEPVATFVPALLKTMEQAGISEERRLPILLYYRHQLRREHADAGTPPPTVVTVDEILRCAKDPALRRASLLEDLKKVRREKTEARKQWQRYLDEFRYAEEMELQSARSEVVRHYIDGDEAEVRRWIDIWAGDPNRPTRRATFLLSIAHHHAGKQRRGEARAIYDDVIRSGEGVASAKWGKAQVLKAEGRNAEMLALLHELAPKPKAGEQPGEGRSASRASWYDDEHAFETMVIETLARHYTAEKQWQAALAEWERWHPRSFCGTCADSMAKTREKNIALCRKMLEQR